MLLEICCGSVDDAVFAQAGGADRIELNSALFLGGLTPTLGTVIETRKAVQIPMMVMIRPRVGGFCYSAAEFRVMCADARLLMEYGADGLVFGCLHPDGTIDVERTGHLIEIAGKRPVVFHRAFDVVPDPSAALETLISLGVTRVLTSGQQPTAYHGTTLIQKLRQQAGDRIEILPGGGIDLINLQDVVDRTGTSQVHLAVFEAFRDTSCCAQPDVYFGGELRPSEIDLGCISVNGVRAIRERLN